MTRLLSDNSSKQYILQRSNGGSGAPEIMFGENADDMHYSMWLCSVDDRFLRLVWNKATDQVNNDQASNIIESCISRIIM